MTPRDGYEVVWSGSSKLSLTDGALFSTKGSYLTRWALVETDERGSGRSASRCPCGRIMRLTPNSQHTHCQLCRLKRG